MMTAGDAALLAEIAGMVIREVAKRIAQEPSNWWKVSEATDLYVKYYNFIRNKRAENERLSPLHLDGNYQGTMSDKFVNDGPALGSLIFIGENVINKLDAANQEIMRSEDTAFTQARGEIRTYVEELTRQAEVTAATAAASPDKQSPRKLMTEPHPLTNRRFESLIRKDRRQTVDK